jgi:peptidoglycan/LPS O-acetylase OafA/YrhL
MTTQTRAGLDYRADINGLRALAVISVLLFHAGFSAFHGGFIGVDVFFVISGYLITKIILRDLETDRFSVVAFYERRARRIIPALMVTVALTFAGAYLLQTPRKFEPFGRSVAAVSMFGSNVLFWFERGYFDSSDKPLLHTWSLGVEEQFYLAFPLLLMAIRRFFAARFVLCIALLAAASFIASLVGSRYAPESAFYLVHMRAWELLLGSILACDVLPQGNTSSRNLLALLGAALFAGGLFLIGPATPFPGFAALLPTVGAACLIHAGAGGRTVITGILSARPVVFIGLISYSLYLLHWPLFVFARQFAIVELDIWEVIGLLLMTILLATLSWWLVEQPFRSKAKVSRRLLFALTGAAVAIAVIAGGTVDVLDGMPARGQVFALAGDTPRDSTLRRDLRMCDWSEAEPTLSRCPIGQKGGEPSFVLWGDSHALVLQTAVDISASQHGATGLQVFQMGCAPLAGVGRMHYPTCISFNDFLLTELPAHPKIRTVILAARWSMAADGRHYKTEPGQFAQLFEGSQRDTSAGNRRLFEAGLTRTVRQLLALGRRVVLVEPIPEIGYDVPASYVAAWKRGRDLTSIIAPSRAEYDERNQVVQTLFEALSKEPGVQIVRVADRLCGTGICRVLDPDSGQVLYLDDNHLSVVASRSLSPAFDELFEQDLKQLR